jgi:hypothetical protein
MNQRASLRLVLGALFCSAIPATSAADTGNQSVIGYSWADNRSGGAAVISRYASEPAYTGTGTGTISWPVISEAYDYGNSAPLVQVETITVTATNATTFDVTGSSSGAHAAATVGVAYSEDGLSFTISAGGTAFEAGDSFTFAITDTLDATTASKKKDLSISNRSMTVITQGVFPDRISVSIFGTSYENLGVSTTGYIVGVSGTPHPGDNYRHAGLWKNLFLPTPTVLADREYAVMPFWDDLLVKETSSMTAAVFGAAMLCSGMTLRIPKIRMPPTPLTLSFLKARVPFASTTSA